jgi:GAF domain
MKAPLPHDEAARLRALSEYMILDTESETVFDDLVAIAAAVCEAPISLISIVDPDRQWFKARVGLDVSETSRDSAFCAHTILGDSTMIVPDALKDERFEQNPLVLGDPNIRFYAGSPLLTPEGHRLGSLCVIDRRPRDLSAEQIMILARLARQASALLQWRRTMGQLASALGRVRTLEELIPICASCKSVRSDEGYWQRVETFITAHTSARLTHGLCPPCAEAAFPGVMDEIERERSGRSAVAPFHAEVRTRVCDMADIEQARGARLS